MRLLFQSTLFTVFALYKPTTDADAVLAAIDEGIAKVVDEGVDDATLARVKTAMLADWYDGLEMFLSRADTLAKLQTLWGDANVANKIPGWLERSEERRAGKECGSTCSSRRSPYNSKKKKRQQ